MYPGTISDMHMMTLRSTEIARMRCAPIAHVGPMSMHPCRHVGPCFMFMFMFMCSCKHVHGSMSLPNVHIADHRAHLTFNVDLIVAF